jgi:hypothetical protein
MFNVQRSTFNVRRSAAQDIGNLLLLSFTAWLDTPNAKRQTLNVER